LFQIPSNDRRVKERKQRFVLSVPAHETTEATAPGIVPDLDPSIDILSFSIIASGEIANIHPLVGR